MVCIGRCLVLVCRMSSDHRRLLAACINLRLFYDCITFSYSIAVTVSFYFHSAIESTAGLGVWQVGSIYTKEIEISHL